MLSHVKNAAAQAARRAALLSAGLLCCLVGLGFLTAAAYVFLSLAYDTGTAALIIGLAYVGLGLVTVAIGLGHRTDHVAYPQERTAQTQAQVKSNSDAPPLVQAFLFGMQAGVAADKQK